MPTSPPHTPTYTPTTLDSLDEQQILKCVLNFPISLASMLPPPGILFIRCLSLIAYSSVFLFLLSGTTVHPVAQAPNLGVILAS